MGFFKQLQHAWNAFFGNNPKDIDYCGGPPRIIDISPTYLGSSYNYDPSRVILSRRTEYSIVNAIYNRIAIDCSSIDIKHVRVDENDKYISTIDSDLNNCLTLEANKDQAHRQFIIDVVESLFDEGNVAIVPTDGTEHITQLNRSIDSNLNSEIDSLIKLLYSQLGITDSILNGTADEKTMLNYMNRTIEPVLNSIVDEMKRKFLTKTARSQRQTIMYFNNPFKLVPLANLADIGDKFTRNAIMSSNEMRQIIGLKPVNDPDADALRNKNLNKDENSATVNASVGTNEDANDSSASSNEKITGNTSLSDLVPKD